MKWKYNVPWIRSDQVDLPQLFSCSYFVMFFEKPLYIQKLKAAYWKGLDFGGIIRCRVVFVVLTVFAEPVVESCIKICWLTSLKDMK